MYRRILVPHDGSLFSERALSVAVPLAQLHGAELIVLQVGSTEDDASDHSQARSTAVMQSASTMARMQVERTVRRLTVRYGIRVSGAFRSGNVVHEEIIRAALELQASLIVIATHGRGGLSRLWLGSTTDALLRETPLPVIVVRTARKYTAVAASDPFFPRIVVAVDGSEDSERALAETMKLVGDDPVHIVLARVEDALLPGPSESWVTEADHRITNEYLEPLAAQYRSDKCRITTRLEVQPDIARALHEISRSERAFLIAVATHGRTGVKRAMLGSVADKIVRGADIPVLIVPRAL